MDKEHDLLAPGIERRGGVWAICGADVEPFALALFKLLGPEAEFYVLDKKKGALEKLRRALTKGAPAARITWMCVDYTQAMELPPLDGLVLVNGLHSVRLERQEEVLHHLRGYLKPDGGRLILVDREERSASLRVRYPVNYESFEYLASAAGFVDVRRLAMQPVGLVREMYSGLGVRAG